ncbi:fimbrial biogenesis chaperone [Wohlfahrtiimonas larvae]|uniref:Fimbria/pilus periplasmic chaperone n=1 Tax=Wohlfahrtiimonas larvae TaxID=1157986 RepID=A0ABP9MT10_9GAMM|nr:molecular chaperone [Wohlfahrtiimonas larvae]
MRNLSKFLILSTLMMNVSTAQLAFDRTRVILDRSSQNSVSIAVENISPKMPFLAQTWIETQQGVKVSEPLVALPMLQRINPKQEKQIKIGLVGSEQVLPQDKESLLSLNILGVPPKDSQVAGQLNIMIKSNLKLFYRPKGLKKYSNNAWVQEMKVSKSGGTYTLENPTPYHIVIYGFRAGKGSKAIEKDVVLKPFSSEKVTVNLGNTPSILYMKDNGGGAAIHYRCNSNLCTVVQ